MKNKITNTLLVLFIILVTISCKKEGSVSTHGSNYLIGTWVNPQYSETQITYDRSAELPENNYGLKFQSEGNLIERKNIGWCGTPPISYGDYEGNWTANDSIVNIEVDYWGGEAKLTWKILSISNNQLTVQILDEEY